MFSGCLYSVGRGVVNLRRVAMAHVLGVLGVAVFACMFAVQFVKYR